ncbi:hypothetical protein [Granulosicoccus antarcticus]|uniref:Uncharacterized protein n=1 Tax=Granulosicoccus antarcticus IMCC3135 TaxID=1192854 RepID=A0A2Z2NWV0_9GAMM|nr:hypothetical protein [Granulosicoccus antarcticus]ASJ73320.1 hypothetical protein IMCC3135_16190 [Granulosicoccus antarcticus IMCC3135]
MSTAWPDCLSGHKAATFCLIKVNIGAYYITRAVENLLHQVSFDQIELTPEQAKRTLLAGIPAIILRESSTLWILGVERSRTRFLVEWLSGLTQSVGENP